MRGCSPSQRASKGQERGMSIPAATTRYHSLYGSRRSLFPQFRRLRSLRPGCQLSKCLVRAASWFTDGCFLLVSSHGGRGSKLSPVSSRHTNAVMRALASWFNYLPRAPSPNNIILKIKISTHELGGRTRIRVIIGLVMWPPQ